MSDYYWDEKIGYLLRSRRLYQNDDCFEFLLTRRSAVPARTMRPLSLIWPLAA